jgi:hypothetical protein
MFDMIIKLIFEIHPIDNVLYLFVIFMLTLLVFVGHLCENMWVFFRCSLFCAFANIANREKVLNSKLDQIDNESWLTFLIYE